MKAEANQFPYITTAQQGSNPSTPATGLTVVFTKSGGLYIRDDSGTVTGPFATASGSDAGAELDYKEFTSPVTVTGATEATADIVVTSDATVFDGSACWFEFFAPYAQPNAVAGKYLIALLFDNTASTSASIGQLTAAQNPASATFTLPFFGRRKLTPSAGTRTYSVRAISNASGSVGAGAGGATNYMPGYLRITRA